MATLHNLVISLFRLNEIKNIAQEIALQFIGL